MAISYQYRKTELWVTDELPGTISPLPLSIPVNGAILESRQIGSDFVFKLMELTKLD